MFRGNFSLTIEDFTGDLQVLSFTVAEGISQPYRNEGLRGSSRRRFMCFLSRERI
ncbi:hypothetical protein SAMN05421862_1505 [Pseudomonas extremaustralis]|jgi:hypothetical protein|nr:hypothetical protein SAMN05421862_1505 [Pseudomonas extremaustralis]